MNPRTRRAFLATLAGCVPVFAASARHLEAFGGTRVLQFSHTHTGERLTVEYFSGSTYVPSALSAVNHLLRDFRTGDVHPIDLALLDLLHTLTTVTETTKPFQVISGYRSPWTNEMLRHRSEGVAAGSLHLKGQAIDIRLADVPLTALRQAAVVAARGGVGFYPRSDFVHVDTGRVRFW